METLFKLLSDAQASLFVLFHKTWVYHWNVIGSDFYQIHKLLGDQYTEMFEEIDRISEHMRYLNVKPLSSIERILEVSKVKEGSSSLTNNEMLKDLLKSNEDLCTLMGKISEEAGKQKSYATSNLVEDLMEAHGKYIWMLRSSLTVDDKLKEEVIEENLNDVQKEIIETSEESDVE